MSGGVAFTPGNIQNNSFFNNILLNSTISVTVSCMAEVLGSFPVESRWISLTNIMTWPHEMTPVQPGFSL